MKYSHVLRSTWPAWLTLCALLVGTLAPLSPSLALSYIDNSVPMQSLIKGSRDTVYWYGSEGKRYVFPNIKTFYSWYDWNTLQRDVRTLSDVQLGQIPLAGNVVYRPGAKLVKVTTDPKVYAVSKCGVLRWVTNEYLAQQFYGADWRSSVQDIPDEFFINYTVGAPIYSTSDYNVSNEYHGVVNPSSNLCSPIINPLPTPLPYYPNYTTDNLQITISANKTSVSLNEPVTFTARLFANGALTDSNQFLINVFDGQGTSYPCTPNNSQAICSVTVPTNNASSQTFYARAVSRDGQRSVQSNSQTIWVNNTYQGTSNGSLRTSVNYGYFPNGITSYLTVTAELSSYTSSLSGFTIFLYDQTAGNQILKTCYNVSSCSITIDTRNLPTGTRTYYASGRNSYGQEILPSTNNPSIQVSQQNTELTGSASLDWAVRTDSYGNSLITFVPNAWNTSLPTSQLDFLVNNGQTNATVATCRGIPCSREVNIGAITETQNLSYYLIVRDPSSGRELPRQWVTVQAVAPNGFGSNATLTGRISNRWPTPALETIEYTATINNPNASVSNVIMRSYNAATGELLATCNGVATCTWTRSSSVQKTERIYTQATDGYGHTLTSSETTVTYGPPQGETALSGSLSVVYVPDRPTLGTRVAVTATLTNANIDRGQLTLRIFDGISNYPIAICYGVDVCRVDYTIAQANQNAIFYAQASTNNASNRITSPSVPVVVSSF